MNRFLIFSLLLGALNGNAQDLDFTKMIQPVPQSAKFEDKGYMVWCGSMVKGDDGLAIRQKYLSPPFQFGKDLTF